MFGSRGLRLNVEPLGGPRIEAMGIDLVIETESGEAEGWVDDLKNHLATALSLPGIENTRCLRFIDHYGDTVFNRYQIPVLISELESLRSRVTDAVLRQQAVRNCEAAKKARWAPTIIRDYETAIDLVASGPVLAHLDMVLELARKADGKVHTYIKFYGD